MNKKLFLTFVGLGIVLVSGNPCHAGEPQKTPVFPSAYFLAWASNGQRCLVKRGIDNYEVFDTEGKQLWGRTMVAYNVYISPDGSKVAYVRAGEGLFVTDLQTDKDQRIVDLRGTQNRITHLAWSPTGQKLAYWLFGGDELTESEGDFDLINPDGSK